MTPSSSPPSEPFKFSTICSDIVYRMLNHLDIHKSTGPDGLSARFLKEV